MSSNSPEQTLDFQEPTTIWNRTFISIFLTNMAFNLGQLMSNSLLSVYADSLGAPATAIGMLMSTFAVSSILFRLISAPIMDTYNRKYIVMFSTVTLAAAFWGFGISSTIPSLIGFRLLQGCGMAFGNACCLAMVSEALPKDKYGSGIGYYSLAQVICQAIGPQVGLWLAGWLGYSMAFTVNAIIMLVSTALAFQIKIRHKRTKKLRLTFNNIIAKEAILPAGIMFTLAIGGCTVGSFLIVFATNKGIANIGLFFTVSAVTMLITRPLIGKLTDRFGLVKIMVPALFCNVIAFFIISYATTIVGFLIAAFVTAFGQGACQPAMQALSMKAVPNERRGAASSMNFIGLDLGNLVGPTIAGSIAQVFGYTFMWRIMVIPFFFGVLAVILFRRTIMRIEENFAPN